MSMELVLIKQMLDTERDCLKINKKMFEKLGIEPAIIYSYLVDSQVNYQKIPIADNAETYLPYPIDSVQKATTLSAFKQRNALIELQNKGLIKIKMGQSKLRLIYVIEDSNIIKDMLFETKLSKFINKNETIQYFLKQIEIFQETTNKNVERDVWIDIIKAINTKNKELTLSK